jgi:hypothetical protein
MTMSSTRADPPLLGTIRIRIEGCIEVGAEITLAPNASLPSSKPKCLGESFEPRNIQESRLKMGYTL